MIAHTDHPATRTLSVARGATQTTDHHTVEHPDDGDLAWVVDVSGADRPSAAKDPMERLRFGSF